MNEDAGGDDDGEAVAEIGGEWMIGVGTELEEADEERDEVEGTSELADFLIPGVDVATALTICPSTWLTSVVSRLRLRRRTSFSFDCDDVEEDVACVGFVSAAAVEKEFVREEEEEETTVEPEVFARLLALMASTFLRRSSRSSSRLFNSSKSIVPAGEEE